LKVKDNILWLNVSGTKVSDNDIETISQFTNLERLRLDANPLTDKGIGKLTGLNRLQSLNVNETNITNDCIGLFGKLVSLKRVYAVKTGIRKEDAALQKTGFTIVSGVFK
jgi:Leucine-rich repeat (LRR) protein